MTNKQIYKQICETEGSRIPLFQQYWWMETVCHGKQWDVLFAYDKAGAQPIAAMPYLIGKKLGMRYVLPPQLTQFGGPVWIGELPTGSEYQRVTCEQEVYGQFVKLLADLRLACFQQNFSPAVTNWTRFYWDGYSQTTRYTYRFEDISNPDAVFALFHKELRQRPIRKAMERLHVVEDLKPEAFVELHHRHWASRGEQDLLSSDFMLRVLRAALERRQAMLLAVADAEGILHSALFVVFDDRCAYSLLSALNPDIHVDKGATPMLYWEIIRRLSPLTCAFDFEGSMELGVEYSHRLYGATPTPFFSISKVSNPMMRLLLALKRAKR